MKLKLALLASLLLGASLYGQGTPVRHLSGSGVPGGTVASLEGTEYVDTSVNPPVNYVCTSVSVASGPTPPAGTQTCNWTQIGGGGGVSPNSPLPAASSGPGPVFNVKNYGAKGDSQSSVNCTAASFNLNCTDVTFTAANVGNYVSCASAFSTIVPATVTFTAFVNATNMTMSASNNGSGTCVFGTPDDAAVSTALTAAIAQIHSIVGTGNLGVSTAAPTLYFPAGAYSLGTTTTTSLNIGVSGSGFAIKGDGADQSKIYWVNGANPVSTGAGIGCNGNLANLVLEGFTMDGANQQTTFSNSAIYTPCNTLTRNVIVQRFNAAGWIAPSTLFANKIVSSANNGNGLAMTGGGEVYESLLTNNAGAGLLVTNNTGANQGQGTRFINNLLDENAGFSGCDVQIVNATDVWIEGTAIFSSTGAGLCGLSVDANSFVHYIGGLVGVFGSESNRGGVTIAAGGSLQASDVHFTATGTAKCITNSGNFNDNGGNSCESQFPIVSGTSTGTTAVLTLTPSSSNVNTNCTVGDALYVKGAGIAGYNGYFQAGATSGITAVTATTLTYTTQGSNLGALGAGGIANCRNLQSYSGTLPKALLNNPIPNSYPLSITPIVNATTYTLGNWRALSATNIPRISASSQVVTTCATAPIITISDGTSTVTLTLTSGKSQWDSTVDSSTGVGTTVFKVQTGTPPTGNITVKYDVAAASACATPPTNLVVTPLISPILSN